MSAGHALSLLAMASRLVDDAVTPVRDKLVAARVADRLRRRLPVTEEEASALQRLYRQHRAKLAAAARWFEGCS